jgi:hypothetical protein
MGKIIQISKEIERKANEINSLNPMPKIQAEFSPELEKALIKLYMAVINYNGKKPFLGTRE